MEKNFGTLVARSIQEGVTVKMPPGACSAMATLRNPGLTDEEVNAGLQDLADVYLDRKSPNPLELTFTEMQDMVDGLKSDLEKKEATLEEWSNQICQQAKDIERYMNRIRQKDEQIENLQEGWEAGRRELRDTQEANRRKDAAIAALSRDIQEIQTLFDLMGMKGDAAMTPAFRLKAHVFGKLKLEVA